VFFCVDRAVLRNQRVTTDREVGEGNEGGILAYVCMVADGEGAAAGNHPRICGNPHPRAEMNPSTFLGTYVEGNANYKLSAANAPETHQEEDECRDSRDDTPQQLVARFLKGADCA